MLVLLFAAFVLPKFVQRTEVPTSEEDFAAALAAVALEEGGEEAESTEKTESSKSLRDDARFSAVLSP